MYLPQHFAETDRKAAFALMRAESFATLVSTGDDGLPFATHIPLLLDETEGAHGTLYGHLARANPHGGWFDGRRPALAIFAGPHAYVSPRWYVSPNMVPTWNYVAVHAAGRPVALTEDAAARDVLRRLSDFYEQGRWRLDDLPEATIAANLRGITAFKLPIERLTAKAKLSQNRKPEDVAGVIAGLEGEVGDALSRATAALMKR